MSETVLELLSPAGSPEIFKSVVDAGADAVYFGGQQFGARAYAANFTFSEAEKAVSYAHLYGKKAYLTVNTLLKNLELERKLYSYMKAYVQMGLDAVIVQDMGVFSLIRECFPDLPIHASTQMTITSGYGARLLSSLGASRVVLARELSLEEIAQVHQMTEAELEVFVHGALCMAYSGQCLMSSMLGGRSGNRGRCAQPCRLPYHLLDEKKRTIQMPGDYLLSPKDLCGIREIAALAKAGVTSLKIEGRMKQKEYAAGVVSVYRHYIDVFLSGRKVQLEEKDWNRLLSLGSRNGFTKGYFHQHGSREMMTLISPAHEKRTKETEPSKQERFQVKGELTAKVGQPLKLSVVCGSFQAAALGENVEAAVRRETTAEEIQEKLLQTGDTPFVFEEVTLIKEEGIFLPMAQVKEIRREALAQLLFQMTKREKAYQIRPFAPFAEETGNGKQHAPVFLALCRTKEQWKACLSFPFLDVVGIGLSLAACNKGAWFSSQEARQKLDGYLKEAKAHQKRLLIAMPLIMRQETARQCGFLLPFFYREKSFLFLASNFDTLQLLREAGIEQERVLLDHRLYTFSNRSIRAFEDMGYEHVCAPLELNQKELLHRYNATSCLMVYGRMTLMITANCQHKNAFGCDKKQDVLYLRDRYDVEFPVKNVCEFCYNEIYNSRISSLLSEAEAIKSMGFCGFRLDFTMESEKETKKVLSMAQSSFFSTESDKEMAKNYSTFTKGHFKRGVE